MTNENNRETIASQIQGSCVSWRMEYSHNYLPRRPRVLDRVDRRWKRRMYLVLDCAASTIDTDIPLHRGRGVERVAPMLICAGIVRRVMAVFDCVGACFIVAVLTLAYKHSVLWIWEGLP